MQALFVLIMAAARLFPTPADTHTLTVVVEGVRGAQGIVGIGLYDANAPWPDTPIQYTQARKVEGQSTYVLTLSDIPSGTYALSVLDDVNANNKMDTSLFGWPQEGFAFSNNKGPTLLGAPSFEACAFEVNADIQQTLALIYF